MFKKRNKLTSFVLSILMVINILTAKITVYADSSPVTSIVLDKSTVELSVGNVTQLIPTIAPTNATDKSVDWSTSHPGCVTVDSSGKVTGVAPGTATITATSKDGSNVSASSIITVKQKYFKARYEAEDGVIVPGSNNAHVSPHNGSSGSGLVGGLNKGFSVSFNNVNAPYTGDYKLTLGYYGGMNGGTLTFWINGVSSKVTIPDLANWDTSGTFDKIIALNEGVNAIKISFENDDSNIIDCDYFDLGTVETPTDTVYAPINLHKVSNTDITASLAWTAPTKGVVASYEIFQNDVKVATTTDATYKVTGLTPDTSYNFTVKTIDSFGNTSLESNKLAVTTYPLGQKIQLRYEAEDMPNSVYEKATDHSGYTGSGFAIYLGYVDFKVDTTGKGEGYYKLIFRYASGDGNNKMSVTVNGSPVVSSVNFNAKGWDNWQEYEISSAFLADGINTIRLSRNDGGINIDRMDITALADPNIVSIDPLNLSAKQGEVFKLPTKVAAKMDNNATRDIDVTWDQTSVDTSTLGLKTVTGTVALYTPKVTLNLTVIALGSQEIIENFNSGNISDKWNVDSAWKVVDNPDNAGVGDKVLYFDGTGDASGARSAGFSTIYNNYSYSYNISFDAKYDSPFGTFGTNNNRWSMFRVLPRFGANEDYVAAIVSHVFGAIIPNRKIGASSGDLTPNGPLPTKNAWSHYQVVVRGDNYKLYVNNSQTPAIDQTVQGLEGGAVKFDVYDAKVWFDNITITRPTSIISVDDLTASVIKNGEYTLPGYVTANMSDGSTAVGTVKWDQSLVDTGIIGEQTITGTVDNYAGVVTLRLSVTEVPVGSVIREYWTNVTGGINSIPVGSTPTSTNFITSLETPTDTGVNNYGERIRGLLTPTQSGDYTFWIAADDAGQFWLSTDKNPENKQLIARENEWAPTYGYDKDASQKSVPITLQAGNKYYFEALHAQGTGGTNLSVAWQGPGVSTREIISGNVLSPYIAPLAPKNPVVDDVNDTFGWTNATGYNDALLYEYSKDGGATWNACTANPQPIGDEAYLIGKVLVRVKSTLESPSGNILASDKIFTIKQSTPPVTGTNTTLWRLGKDDNSLAEFSDYSSNNNETITVPSDWSTKTDWTNLSKGMKLSKNGNMTINYNLDSIPTNGAEFNFRVLDASDAVPQVAVFSNGTMAGMVQIAGLSGNTYKFKQTYRVYIPKEFLKLGANTLKLVLDHGQYAADISGDQYMWFVWDELKLDSLAAKATEPINGHYVNLGTALNPVGVSTETAMNNIDATKWLGIAYSGNAVRTGDYGRNFLSTLKEYNLAPVVVGLDNLFADSNNWNGTRNGLQTINDNFKNGYKNLINFAGDLIPFLELPNEPCIFDKDFGPIKSGAQYIQDQKPTLNPWMKLTSPGYAFMGSKGLPTNWDSDPNYLRQIDEFCDVSNGHSYSTSGLTNKNTGMLVEYLKVNSTYTGDGFTKPVIISETGSSSNAADQSKYGTDAHKYTAVFDRELRGDIGFADSIIQHALCYNEGDQYYSIVKNIATNNIDNLEAWVKDGETDTTRMQVFRRLALSYATHGTPLTYTYTDNNTQDKKSYFRAVDTSGLGKSTIGAQSNKILLSYVNFDTATVTMNVKVKLPEANKTYYFERYGAGNKYIDVHSVGTFTSDSNGDLVLPNQAISVGEAVEYILTPGIDTVAPVKPIGLKGNAPSYKQIDISWNQTTDNVNVSGYNLYVDGAFKVKLGKYVTYYTDFNLSPSSSHKYKVQAFDEQGNVSDFSDEVSIVTQSMLTTPYTLIDGGYHFNPSDLYHEPGMSYQDFGTAVQVYFDGGLTILNAPIKPNTKYTLTVRYKPNGAWFSNSPQESFKGIWINGVFDRQMHLPIVNTDDTVTINIPTTVNVTSENYNTIQIDNKDCIYEYISSIDLKEGTIDETPKPAWITIPNNDGVLYYTSNFKDNGASTHTTNTPGESVSMAFKGTGFRWYADAGNPDDVSQIYIDGVLDTEVKLSDIAAGATNAIAYENMALSKGLHVVKVVNKTGNTIVRNMSFYSLEKVAIPIGPNMAAVRVYTEPANPMPGQDVKLHVVAKNIGAVATPNGIVTGVAFMVNGAYVVCEDKVSKSIEPGETIDLVSNVSINVGSVARTFKLTAVIDDISRYSDMDRTNNAMDATITVGQPNSMSLDSESYTIAVTKTHDTILTATYKDESQNLISYNATSYAQYLSDNTDVAVVDSNGVVTAMSNGQANISVSYAGVIKHIAVVVVGTVVLSTDATLSDLKVNVTTVAGFSVDTTDYNVELPTGTTAIPTVTGTATAIGKATMTITQAAALPGIATVVVTAEDGITTKTYTINFTVAAPIVIKSTDATLSDLKIGGTTVTGFSASTTSYDVVLSAGTTAIPTVIGTVTALGKANKVITQATTLPGTSTVIVTAEDGITTKTYKINFTVATPSPTPGPITLTNTDLLAVINAIKNAILNGEVTVDLTANKIVLKDIFDALKGIDKTVTFIQNGVVWSFNGKDLTGDTKAIDMTVKVETIEKATSGNKAEIKNIIKNKDAMVISFANNGLLPGKATVKIKLDSNWVVDKDKNNIGVYYYNEATKRMETVANKIKIDADNIIQFDITHNSDYILLDNTTSALEQYATARLSGANRYETSVKVSQSAWTNSDNVVLATGDDFADALCAAPFAKGIDAPILLTGKTSLDDSVSAELVRLKVKKVYIIGGIGALSLDVEAAIKAMNITVERISGDDRYATSLAIAQRISNVGKVFVCTGVGFADALSISSYAAATNSPILLINKDEISLNIFKYITDSKSKVYVIGGTGVISDKVLNSVAGAERIAGEDRYSTNIAVVNKFASDLNFENIYIATGENYPDAICGSVAAGMNKSPIILVNSNVLDETKTLVKAHTGSAIKVIILGGEGAVTTDTVNKVLN